MPVLGLLAGIDMEAFRQALDAIGSSLGRFRPELELVVVALTIIILDLLLPRAASRHLAWVALGGCVWIASGIEVGGAGQTGSLFAGMLADDSFARFFKLFFLIGAVPVILLSWLSRDLEGRRMGEYYGILLASLLGAMMLASSTHFLMVFLSLELLSIASYVLVGYRRDDRRGSEAALKYIIYGSVAAAVMLFGMSLLYGLTGSAELGAVGDVIRAGGAPAGEGIARHGAVISLVALLLVYVGLAYKIASVPMHFWAPDVYEGAPTPVTAFLSVISKAAGLAVALRTVQVLADAVAGLPAGSASAEAWSLTGVPEGSPWVTLLILVSVATMTLGNLAALWQNDLKRMFAYSSIAHAGYMLMGLAILRPSGAGAEVGGAAAVGFYLLTYLAMNFGAFSVILLVENRTGGTGIDGFRGLGRRAPLLAAGMVVFLFSLIGVPPTAGFTGKWQLFMGVLDTAHPAADVFRPEYYGLALAAVVNTAISAYYYLRIAKEMYMVGPGEQGPVRSPLVGRALVVACVVLTFYLFLRADGILQTTAELAMKP